VTYCRKTDSSRSVIREMSSTAQGPWSDLALHTLGWKAFQDLCSQVCAEVLKRPVEIYREAQDGGQDAIFLTKNTGNGSALPATIQCKFSSRSTQRLAFSSLNTEEESILKLVQLGEADTYVLMTSMGTDAGVARRIKDRLRQLGVRKPHVLGREFLTLAIRSSARLRAMVPQIYGLGDLSTILDKRRAEQTRALLGQWLPTLRLYVPTVSHRRAVHALAEHRIVLLLGNAATGKSTLAAVLSAMACDGGKISCFQTTGPRDFGDRWNPNESSRFYWIDDAFGPNQPRDEYIQDWADIFRKVQAATSAGNRFVLTSRRHIYEAAKVRLGSRNLPVFASEQAV
jgi:Novel STAND NTPase 3